jgi:phage gp46-like protein
MITNEQQGDVHLFQTLDGGNITIVGGIVEMSNGLGVAAYISLFGANSDDNGLAGNPLSWWGNTDEPEVNQIRSETQYLLTRLPQTTSNLLKIEDAIQKDLSWMLLNNIASTIDVDVTIPALNRINIKLDINAQGTKESFNFTENWEASIR